MSARQNKRQRTKRNPNIHRERTVTTLTGNDDDEHSFGVASNTDEQPSSYSSMMPTGLPFGFNSFVGPINTGMHPQQQQYYLQQPSMLPPGQKDLEILENLKDTIKRGQNPFFRAVPNPSALASIYLGSSSILPHPEQTSRVDAQVSSMPENSNDDQGRRPHMPGKEAWESPRKLSVSSGQNNALSSNLTPQDSPKKLSQDSVLKENSKTNEGGGPNSLSGRPLPPPSSAGKDERPLGRETYPPPPTSRDSDRTAPPPSSASVASSPSSNAPTARDSATRYHDSRDRDRDLRDRDRDWDRDNYLYRRDDRRISDVRRPDYSDARPPHEPSYPPRRYDSKDDYAGSDRRRDDRLPPRPDSTRVDLPPRPDERYPPRPDERLPPRPDDRYSHRPDDRVPYERRVDDRPPHRPDDRPPHRYEERRFDRPIIGESRVAALAAAERERAAAAAAAAAPPPAPPSRSSVSRPPPPSSGPTQPLEDRGAGRPPPPPVVDNKAPARPPPPKLEERISRAPTLQERLSQPPTTPRVAEPPTRTLSLEERLSHAPVINNTVAATTQSDDRRTDASNRDRPGPSARPDERSSSAASSAGRGGNVETVRPLPPVSDDRDRPPPAAATGPRVTDDTRGRTMDRFASRGTTPAPARPAAAAAVPPSAPSNYNRAASVARDDSRRPSPTRHDGYRSSVPLPPPRDVSRDRQVAVNSRAHNYRPGDERAYNDRHRDTMDVDPPSSSRYGNGEYRRVPSPAPLPPRRTGYPPSPPPTRPAVDTHSHGAYEDRDRRLSSSGGREHVYDSERRRDWPPAEDDPYYKSRPAYPLPPPSDRDRYERDTREMAPLVSRSATWDSRTPSGPATGSSYHSSTRTPPPRSSTAIPEVSSGRPITSRVEYQPLADDRERYLPPRVDTDRPRYAPSAAAENTYSRVRARSPSPARRPAVDDRPPIKRPREDMYPPSNTGSHYPTSSYSRDVPSAPRRPSDYLPPRSATPPTSGYYPPPSSSVDRDYRRDYPASYDSRPRSPPRSAVSGGYASSSGYRADSRDERRYMPPPPPPR